MGHTADDTLDLLKNKGHPRTIHFLKPKTDAEKLLELESLNALDANANANAASTGPVRHPKAMREGSRDARMDLLLAQGNVEKAEQEVAAAKEATTRELAQAQASGFGEASRQAIAAKQRQEQEKRARLRESQEELARLSEKDDGLGMGRWT